MKSISDEIYIIKRLNYGLIRGKKVKILEGVVLKHLAVEPFGRGDGDITQGRAIADWRWLACGRTWLQRYWNSLNAIRLPWQSGH